MFPSLDTLPAWKRSVNLRFGRAITQSGLSLRQVEKKLLLPRNFLSWVEEGGRSTESNSMAIAVGQLCDVDPRWLATGEISPAAVAAIAGLERALEGSRVTDADRAKLREFFETMAQPALNASEPTCRYCGCVEARACPGGCRWVDDETTICSACLFGE
jgi:transcriptional regulator with XRE-family HTH domain